MVFLILWIFILGIMLVVYLLFPILSKGHIFPEVDQTDSRIQMLTLEREQCYASLADLDEDFETGKLSDKDYQNLRAGLLQETVKIVSQLEEAAEIDVDIAEVDVEAEIERYKQQKQR